MPVAISVVIPCYNYGKYIREAVESVLNQTFRDFEIVIVNDGSTDEDTIRILGELKKEHPSIILINQENGHIANARNNGIKASSGEFFFPLDADDKIEPTMLEKCLEEMMKNNNLGNVYTHTKFFGDTDAVQKRQEYNFYNLLEWNYIVVSSLIRRKAFDEVGGYDENMENGYEDWELYIRLGKNGWFGKLIKEPLFCYRQHGRSMNVIATEKHALNTAYIHEKHPDLYSKEALREIEKKWKPLKKGGIFNNFSSKLEATGVTDINLWKKSPVTALGRLVPVRMKRKINSIFKKRLFDISYYHRNG